MRGYRRETESTFICPFEAFPNLVTPLTEQNIPDACKSCLSPEGFTPTNEVIELNDEQRWSAVGHLEYDRPDGGLPELSTKQPLILVTEGSIHNKLSLFVGSTEIVESGCEIGDKWVLHCISKATIHCADKAHQYTLF